MLVAQRRTKPKAKEAKITPGQNLAGLLLVAVLLAGWRLLFNAAGWFAPFLAAVGLGCWWLSLAPVLKQRSQLKNILSVMAWWLMLLAIVAALSLGVFLPSSVAEWGSPVLGKFGGAWALALLAVGVGAAAISGYATRNRTAFVDFALACGLAALWVHYETARQVTFPSPPTSASAWLDRLNFLVIGAALCLAASVPLIVASLQKPVVVPGEAAPTIIPPAFKFDYRAIRVFLLRWSVLIATFGFLVSVGLLFLSDLAPAGQNWYLFLIVGLLAGGLLIWQQNGSVSWLKEWGWLFLMLLSITATYLSVTEDLEIVLLRNTGERYSQQIWRKMFGDERFAIKSTGQLTGIVRDADGQPLAQAHVAVATVSGQAFSAETDSDGRYTIENIPQGNYLPLAAHAGYIQNAPNNRVVTVQQTKTTQNVDFNLQAVPPLNLSSNNSLVITPTGTVTRDNPELSNALRYTFSFENRGKRWDNGLIHEPPAEMGNGPFPILLIVYPGQTTAWEGVSIPLAAKGYVVVSYFPNRLLDLAGDIDDLRQLMSMTFNGQMSKRGDGRRVAFVGGSVSTVYTYLMAQEIAGSSSQQNFKAAVNYGGLFNMFRFRQNWEEGQVIIDPGISELEYLLIAFGRPDTRPELYMRFSPYYIINKTTLPPTMLVHVNKDIIVPVEQTQLAANRLQQLGVDHYLLLYPELAHYLDMSKRDPAYADMLYKTIAFLQEKFG